MDSFGRPNLSVERGIRLAKEHLDEAEEALHAEQRTGERVFDMDVTYTGDGTAPGAAMAQREMTPDEIRVDELLKFAERVSLIEPTTHQVERTRDEVQQIIRGRIDVLRPDREGQPRPEALRPEQTSSEQVLDQMTGGRRDPGIRFPGLSYRQAAADGIAINGEHRHILHGEKLALGIELSHGSEPYLIEPYQVDQLMAIADGRPSWPESSQPEGPETTFNVSGLVDWLIESVERRLAARAARR